MTWLSKPAKDV